MTRTDVHSGSGSLLSAFAGLASPVRAGLGQPRHAAAPGARHGLAGAINVLLAWSERARQRRELLQFDDHLLRDIGLTRAEAIMEAEKPFWRA